MRRQGQGQKTQKVGRFSPSEERRHLYLDAVLALQGEEFVWDFAVLAKAVHMTFWKTSDPRLAGVVVREDDIR